MRAYFFDQASLAMLTIHHHHHYTYLNYFAWRVNISCSLKGFFENTIVRLIPTIWVGMLTFQILLKRLLHFCIVNTLSLDSIMARGNFYMLPTPEYHSPNSNLRWHLERTTLVPTEKTVFNHSTRIPNLHAANSGAFHGQYHCSLSSASSRQSLPYLTQYAPYCYDQRTYTNGANMIYPQEENLRVALKRKHPSTHPAYQNVHGYCSSGSNLRLKPLPGCCWPQSSTSIATGYPNDNFSPSGEQHQRNVRSRHGDASFNLSWQSSSSKPPNQLYTSVNNSSSNVVGQWGLPPFHGTHAHFIHPTIGGDFSSYVMNHSVAGNVITGGNTNNHSAYYSEQFRNQYSLLPTSHAFAPRGTVAGRSRYNHKQTSAAASEDFAPSVAGPIAFPQNPRPLIRNEGLRISNEAQRLFNEENGHVRWTSQDSAMIDVPSNFNPINLFDEHRDLRLDIDEMSYEELLDLEDRIGNVNTGLSEDHLSCLRKTTYCSSTPALEYKFEPSCPICLEEYRDKDKLGMMKCLHVYHASCINDWLRIKNACPVCKSPALEDMP